MFTIFENQIEKAKERDFTKALNVANKIWKESEFESYVSVMNDESGSIPVELRARETEEA